MAVPNAIAGALNGVEVGRLPGRPAIGEECAGALYHSPTPLSLRFRMINGKAVWLCGTCYDNAALLEALLDHHGELEWPVRREFGNRLRQLLIPKETDG